MMKGIVSVGFGETISYYTEDIDLCENGEYIAPGVGDTTGAEYDVFFVPAGAGYTVRRITRHNR